MRRDGACAGEGRHASAPQARKPPARRPRDPDSRSRPNRETGELAFRVWSLVRPAAALTEAASSQVASPPLSQATGTGSSPRISTPLVTALSGRHRHGKETRSPAAKSLILIPPDSRLGRERRGRESHSGWHGVSRAGKRGARGSPFPDSAGNDREGRLPAPAKGRLRLRKGPTLPLPGRGTQQVSS
jgi:hypothetical protein